jgi:hypothetical protein
MDSGIIFGQTGRGIPTVVSVDDFGRVNVNVTSLSGSVGLVPAISGGLTTFRQLSSATFATNNVLIKGSPGQIYGYHIVNNGASFAFVKLYNMNVGPTGGVGTPQATLGIPGNASSTGAGVAVSFPQGIPFTTGIAICVTGLYADSDTTAVAAGQIVTNIFYL